MIFSKKFNKLIMGMLGFSTLLSAKPSKGAQTNQTIERACKKGILMSEESCKKNEFARKHNSEMIKSSEDITLLACKDLMERLKPVYNDIIADIKTTDEFMRTFWTMNQIETKFQEEAKNKAKNFQEIPAELIILNLCSSMLKKGEAEYEKSLRSLNKNIEKATKIMDNITELEILDIKDIKHQMDFISFKFKMQYENLARIKQIVNQSNSVFQLLKESFSDEFQRSDAKLASFNSKHKELISLKKDFFERWLKMQEEALTLFGTTYADALFGTACADAL